MKLNKKIIISFVGLLLIALALFTFNSVKKKEIDISSLLNCKNCNVVIISITGARVDHLSTYGYNRITSPNISKLAQNGIVFTNAFTQASRTIPAGLSLLNSQYPYTHGVLDTLNSKKDLNPKAQSLAEILKKNGYKTAAFTGGGDYKGVLGLNKGFDVYEDSQDFSSFVTQVPKAIDWLSQNKDNRFFLFLQGFDVHCPYTQPAPYSNMFDNDYKNKNNIDFSICYWSGLNTSPIEKNGEKEFPLRKVTIWGRTTTGNSQEDWEETLFNSRDIQHLVALYDGSIAYADSQIKIVLDTLYKLKLDKNTIIVFTADHGELLGEQGRFTRGGYLTGTFNDAVINIPLIIKYPQLEKTKKIEGLSQIIDIAPTILDSLGIPNYRYSQGKSLLSLITANQTVNEYIYGGISQYRQQDYRHPYTGINEVDVIRNKEWKLIKESVMNYDDSTTQDKYELYNIKSDPRELINILEKEPSIVNNLKIRLKQWEQEVKQPTNLIKQNPTTNDKSIGEQEFIKAGMKRGYY